MSEALAGSEPGAADPSQKARRARRARGRLRRLVAAAALLALVAVVLAIVVLVTAGGSPQGAARVVPADALGFVDVSLDQRRGAVGETLRLARQLPDFGPLSASVGARVGAVLSGGRAVDLTAQVLPWAGGEAALALLNTTTATAGSLIILDVRDRARALAFIRGEGAVAGGAYRRVRLYAYRSGSELALVSHFLVVGQDASVRAAVDVAAGAAPSLASSASYQQAMAPEPANRVLSAYASLAGVRRLLSPRGGLVGALGDLLYQPALQGVAIGVEPTAGGARVLIHSALDPTLQRLGSGQPTFTPTLQNVLPAGSLLMLDVHGLDRAAPALLRAGTVGGVAAGVGQLLSRLGGALGAEGVNLHAVTSLFSGETAVGVVPGAQSPTLVIVARARDQAQVLRQLAELEIPLSQLFQPPSAGPGSVPELGERSIDGVTDHQLSLTGGLELDYAVFHGLVVISTSVSGIAAVAGRTRTLAEDPAFRGVLAGHPARLTSLVYMALPQLVALGRRTDLISGAGFRRLAPDLAAVAAAGLSTTRSAGESSVRLNLRLP